MLCTDDVLGIEAGERRGRNGMDGKTGRFLLFWT